MTTQPANDNDQSWRNKYFDALGTQDRLEEALEEQYQRMRRALVQLSIVADGQDQQLDPLLDQLRNSLRGERAQAARKLPALAEELNTQVHSFEERRREADAELLAALTRLVQPLQKLGISRSLKKELNHYLDRLPARSQQAALFPALLEQLADMQNRALEEIRQAKPGILQRIKGGEEDRDQTSERLQTEISQVLESLLGAVNGDYLDEEELTPLVERAKAGLTLDALPGFLEEVRDLVRRAWLGANRLFASYLTAVNTELEDITRILGGATEAESSRSQASDSYRRHLAEQCDSLAGQVEDAEDLQDLKTQVSGHLGQIRETLSQFQRSEAQAGPLTEQLQILADRVQSMEREAEQNRESLRRHRHKALHDGLTQLPNREAYQERLSQEFKRWQRYGNPLSLAICDVDHFKKINDNFGHVAGDRVLKVISKAIRRRLRDVDFFGRYGGEEFVILMPETRGQDAQQVLDDLRAALADMAFQYRKEPLSVTLSIGVAEFTEGDTAERVFDRADRALYAAKAAGRNLCQLG